MENAGPGADTMNKKSESTCVKSLATMHGWLFLAILVTLRALQLLTACLLC